MLCGELFVAARKSAPTPLSVRVTRYSAVKGFLDEFIKVLPVVGCVIVVGCCDVVIPV